MPEGFRIASAYVSVSPDLEGFEAELKSELDAATAGAEAKVRVGADLAPLDADLDKATEKLAGIDGLEAKARLTADSEDLTRKADEASARLDELDGKTARPRLDLNDAAFRRQLAEDEAEARSFGDSSFHPLIAAATAGITASLPGIGGAVTGLGALGGAGALAFGGISTAVQAASQATQGASQASAQYAATEFSNAVAVQQAQQSVAMARQQQARDAITSAQQVASAEASLAVTERDSAAQQVAALEAVASAQHQVGQAQFTLTQAQYGYNQAVIQARQNIIALNDQLADQKLSVDAAKLAVQEAEYQQRQVDANALSTELDRQQAALAVAQAKQQVKDSTDSEANAQQAANQANQQGVYGSQQVIQAKNALEQAQYGVAQAAQAYADAQAALTRTELDNAAQVAAAEAQVAQAKQQQAFQAQSDAQNVANAQQQLTNTAREQQLQLAATGGAAQTLAADLARLSPEGRQVAEQIIGMRDALKGLEDVAQSAVLPGFSLFLEGVQSLLPEVSAGIAAVGQGLGNSFAQAGQAMQTSGVRQVLDGLIENGIVFDNTVLPALARFGGALADAGAQKGAVDGLAQGLAGIADGLTGVVQGVQPYEAGVSELLSSVGTVADAVGRPLGTLVGVVSAGLSPALQALDPVVLQVGGDLVTVFTAARPVLTEASQLIADMAPGASVFASVLTGTLVGALDVVDFALKPIDVFASSGFGRAISGEIGFALTALGAWKLANSALGLGSLVQGISNAITVTRGLAVAEGEAQAAGAFGWIATAAQEVRDFAVATEGATLAERALFAAEVAADAINPLGWVALGIGAVTALGVALYNTQNGTESYIATLGRQDQATGYNIAGYEKLATQLAAAAGEQQQVNNATLYTAQLIPAAGEAVSNMRDKVTELTAAQRDARSEASNLTGALGTLESQYGLTASQAEQLATAAGVQARTLAGGGSAAQSAMAKIEAYANANLNAHGAIEKTSSDFTALANDTLTASSRTSALDDAFQTLVGNFVSSQQTRLQVQQDFLTLASNAQQAGASMGGTNQQSLTLGESLYQTISDIRQNADAMVQDGDSAQQVATYLQGVIAKLGPYTQGNRDAQTAVQGLTTYVDGLIASLKKIPPAESTRITVTGTGQWQVAPTGQGTTGFPIVKPVPAGHAAGGLITGPGGPTGDRIPILASDREFMISAAAVDRYGVGLFEALNAQKLAAGGPVTGAYSGSVAGLPAWDSKELTATVSAIASGLAATALQAAAGSGYNAVPAQSGSAAAAQRFASAHLAQFGWDQGQMPPLIALWNQESGWNDYAVNPSSGAYGIPQALPAAWGHPYALGDYANQVLWGLSYIRGRYGSPAAAEQHELSSHWYDGGGWLPPGVSVPVNQTGRPEAVLTPAQSDAFLAAVEKLTARGGSTGAPVVNLNYFGTQDPTPEQRAIMMRELSLALG